MRALSEEVCWWQRRRYLQVAPAVLTVQHGDLLLNALRDIHLRTPTISAVRGCILSAVPFTTTPKQACTPPALQGALRGGCQRGVSSAVRRGPAREPVAAP